MQNITLDMITYFDLVRRLIIPAMRANVINSVVVLCCLIILTLVSQILSKYQYVSDNSRPSGLLPDLLLIEELIRAVDDLIDINF